MIFKGCCTEDLGHTILIWSLDYAYGAVGTIVWFVCLSSMALVWEGQV